MVTISIAGEDPLASTEEVPAKEPKSMNFFSKFVELQLLMLQHNAGLTASHPYASNPINWPFLLSGISFWTENDSQKQIYLIGNILGWWVCVVALSIYVGIIGADLLARRRGVEPIPDGKYTLLLNLVRELTIPISCPQSVVEQHWLLHSRLGRSLCTLLPHEQAAFHSPLSSISSCVRPCCGFRPEFRSV